MMHVGTGGAPLGLVRGQTRVDKGTGQRTDRVHLTAARRQVAGAGSGAGSGSGGVTAASAARAIRTASALTAATARG